MRTRRPLSRWWHRHIAQPLETMYDRMDSNAATLDSPEDTIGTVTWAFDAVETVTPPMPPETQTPESPPRPMPVKQRAK